MINVKRTSGGLRRFTAPSRQEINNFMAWVDGRFIKKPIFVNVTHQSHRVASH